MVALRARDFRLAQPTGGNPPRASIKGVSDFSAKLFGGKVGQGNGRVFNPLSGGARRATLPAGKPRALLEVKSPDIPPEVYEARLRGYDRAKATAARARLGTPKLMQGWQSGHTVTAGSFFCV